MKLNEQVVRTNHGREVAGVLVVLLAATLVTLLLATSTGCVMGKPLFGDQPVVNETAAQGLVMLREYELGFNVVVDVVWEMRQDFLITREQYRRFDVLAQRAVLALQAARDAILLFLEARSKGLEGQPFRSTLAIALDAVTAAKTVGAEYRGLQLKEPE